MNYNFKLDLTKILGASIVENDKGKFVVIPVEKNDIYTTDKGSAYMSFVCREMKAEKFGQTHFIKQNVSKKMFKEMTDEERKNIPILGGLSPDNGGQYSSNNAQTPFNAPSTNSASNNYNNLPF